jgi:spore germination cell wall hydrolase CwlJ-like protein
MKRLLTAAATLLMAGAVAFAAWPTETKTVATIGTYDTPSPSVTTIAYAPPPAAAPSETAAPAPTEPPAPRYTERDIEMLAKMVWGEARGCAPAEQSLCVWTVINRLEVGGFGDTLEEVLTAPHQFVGYKPNHPVTDEIRAVVEDALAAWESGEAAPTFPPYAETSGYLFFTGRRGDDGQLHNFFKEEWR